MKYFKIITIILIILLKTGNNLYAESIFTVNNVQVNKNSFKNKEELINIAFIKGFEKLNSKILLEKDYIKTKKTSLSIIKNLVSHYQIIKNNNENLKIEKDLKILDLRKINVNKIILFELEKRCYF